MKPTYRKYYQPRHIFRNLLYYKMGVNKFNMPMDFNFNLDRHETVKHRRSEMEIFAYGERY